jgi:hypothetical protein
MADSKDKSESKQSSCCCLTDPFAELPPEARPPARSRMGRLRQVTCPGCGLKYWTNRSTDLCKGCQKKDIKITP